MKPDELARLERIADHVRRFITGDGCFTPAKPDQVKYLRDFIHEPLQVLLTDVKVTGRFAPSKRRT